MPLFDVMKCLAAQYLLTLAHQFRHGLAVPGTLDDGHGNQSHSLRIIQFEAPGQTAFGQQCGRK